AKRVKKKEVNSPIDNKKEFEELPPYLKNGIKIHFISYFSDALKIAYGKKTTSG
ncbi:MAG: hypothetical protein HQK54_11360, partial [Oligoflexales bacterium]|nr:hypothetical protein [Oligoflexales bacterium]